MGGRTVFPGLFAISEPAGLVNYPGGLFLPVTSMACPQDWWQARVNFDDLGSTRRYNIRRSNLVADEFIR